MMADRLPKSFRDRAGDTWYRNEFDRYHLLNALDGCSKQCPWTLALVENTFSPLTNFEYDEPAPEPDRLPKSFKDGDGDTWYPHADGEKYCAGGDCPAAKSLEAARVVNHGLTRAEVDRVYGIAPEPQWYQGELHRVDIRCSADDNDVCDNPEHYKAEHPEPTARKAEPGDRVRVTYEAEYYERFPTGVHVLTGNRVAPADAEITVIERAAPKVPDNPMCDVDENLDDWEYGLKEWTWDGFEYEWQGLRRAWPELWRESQEAGSRLYPVTRTRGAVIGGDN